MVVDYGVDSWDDAEPVEDTDTALDTALSAQPVPPVSNDATAVTLDLDPTANCTDSTQEEAEGTGNTL
jgi:hypothetical protein